MAVKSEGKTASAGLAGSVMGFFALLLVISGLTLGLGARHDGMVLVEASTRVNR